MDIFRPNRQAVSRWADFENPSAQPGAGARENARAKGHAFESLAPGQTVTLLNASGSGIIRRIWMTLSDRSPHTLRALTLSMYWDGAATPAVRCPLADFFGHGLALPHPFESELFSSPEGRSFNCFVPMPFFTGARITLSNESKTHVKRVFYDVDFTLEPLKPGEALYFHAFWNREAPTRLLRDYTVLPRVDGHGLLLGVSLGVLLDDKYQQTWFGEGEVKLYVDGDDALPTLVGTGIEDYIGTAWGQGLYAHRTQGSLESDLQTGRFAFYRLHTVDPIYFQENMSVRVQQIGGAPCAQVLALLHAGVNLRIVSADSSRSGFKKLYEVPGYQLNEQNAVWDAWYNFYREDDYASTAYFYLDRPENGLPELPAVSIRQQGMEMQEQKG